MAVVENEIQVQEAFTPFIQGRKGYFGVPNTVYIIQEYVKCRQIIRLAYQNLVAYAIVILNRQWLLAWH